jgi:MoaA/NifB/PqqE/SkfB family radical SAM enzyme
MATNKIRNNYFPELKSILFGRKRPSNVSVNITNRCNQHCVYCEIGQGEFGADRKALSREELFWIVDQMAVEGIKKLSINGGEPFIHSNLIEVVAYAWQHEIRCNITSNGMLIHCLPDEDLSILARCKTQINISIDSFNPEIQNITRGNPKALENALLSIKRLQKYKVPVILVTVISSYNFHELFPTFEQAYRLGIQEVLYQPVIWVSNFPETRVLDEKHRFNVPVSGLAVLNNQLDKILEFEKRHRIKTNVYRLKPWIAGYLQSAEAPDGRAFYQGLLKKFYCREAHAVIDISYAGGIQLCGLVDATSNMRDGQVSGLTDLWMNSTQAFKDALKKGNFPIECKGCAHKFSRNMLASVMKYPAQNRNVLLQISGLLANRIFHIFIKKIRLNRL